MNYEIFQSLVGRLANDSIAFYNSPFFWVIKVLLGIYIAVLLADVILLLVQRNVISNVREGFTIGMNIPEELTTQQKKLKQKWLRIKEGLRGEEESEYKIAILKADELIDNLIGRIGFEGANMAEKLDKILPGQLDNVEELRAAHEMRNRIVHEEDLRISREEAEKILGLYEKFLDYFGVMD